MTRSGASVHGRASHDSERIRRFATAVCIATSTARGIDDRLAAKHLGQGSCRFCGLPLREAEPVIPA